jgi:membrane protease YdiL (CAAX protease family)
MKHALIGFLVSSLGIAVWSLLLFLLPTLWAVLAMVPVLCVYWRYFTGKYIPGPRGGGRPWDAGRLHAGATGGGKGALSGPQVIAALLFVLIVQASFVVTFCLFPFPAERFTADYKQLGGMAPWTAWVLIIMSSIVAAICEETGFRGYMQVPLQKRYGPTTAIIWTSLFFTLIHLSHRWAAPILPQIFFASVLLGLLAYRSGSLVPGIIGHAILDVFDYSFWWTTITGKIDRQTIFATGIDPHFVCWVLLLAGACLAFFRVINTPTFTKHQTHLP